MARLYRLTEQGAKVARWYVTEKEAELVGGASATIEARDYDELELRRLAAERLNDSEIRRLASIKREANKTAEKKKEIAAKMWAKRRANQKG